MAVRIALAALALALAGCGAVNQSSGSKQEAQAPPEPWVTPVPKAECGPDDLVETALQGQVPQGDRVSGRSQEGYTCNLALTGQWAGEGASWQMAWLDDCAYYGQARLLPGGTIGQAIPAGLNRDAPPRAGHQDPGTVVVDVADPANPLAVTYLTTPGMLDPWESLKVNQRRQLLGAVEQGGPGLDLYDISGDCRAPKEVAIVDLATTRGHAGGFTPDGLTYWGSYLPTGFIYPVDIADPANPVLLANWQPTNGGRIHDVSFSEDGNRGYLANNGGPGNGLVIIDTAQVQSRAADPDITIVSEFLWTDGSTSQETQPVVVAGRPMILFSDEGGKGAARLIDITDEANPVLVSKLMLEVHDPANASQITEGTNTGGFGYEGHYCDVDDPLNVTLIACAYFQSGLRVFDVRDPWHPKEIAYYNPPAVPGYKPGSNYSRLGLNEFADWTSSDVRVIPERGEIWFTSQENGFQVVRLTNGVWPLK